MQLPLVKFEGVLERVTILAPEIQRDQRSTRMEKPVCGRHLGRFITDSSSGASLFNNDFGWMNKRAGTDRAAQRVIVTVAADDKACGNIGTLNGGLH